MKLAVALSFLALNFYTYQFLATEPVLPPRAKFEQFPLRIGDWKCAERGKMPPAIERNLGVTDYLLCRYAQRTPPRRVEVYVGYHATQVREEGGGSDANPIHPPAHCLPGSGWDIIDNRTVQLEMPGLPGGKGSAKHLIIAKGEARQLVYYWYQSRGRAVSQDWKKILYVGWDRAVTGRTDGSLVRFSVPIVRNAVDRAEAAFHDLAPLLLAHLPDYVPE